MSFLPLVASLDSFPSTKDPFFWELKSHEGALLGYLVPSVARKLGLWSQHFIIDESCQTVAFASHLTDFTQRNEIFAQFADALRQEDTEVARAWRNELYAVYNPLTVPYVLMERAVAVLMGVVTYGVHINGYVPANKTKDGVLKMWIPRRLATKQTYPGMLDNTVAGGLAYPLGIWENAVKECYEEAGLDKEFVELHIQSAGVVSYYCQPYGPKGHPQPEVEYIYDLCFELEDDHIPHTVDGEAEDFRLMSLAEIEERILRGEFKKNCAVVIVDFMIRHGLVTPQNEPNFLQVVARCHRQFPFATRN